MLLRALVAAQPSARRRQIVNAVDVLDTLVRSTNSIQGILGELASRPFDLLILDETGLERIDTALIDEIRSYPEAPEVLVLSEKENLARQAEWLAAGCIAEAYKGSDDRDLIDLLGSIAVRRRRENAPSGQLIPDADYELGDYATKSPVMRAFLKSAKKVADSNSTLLILGETGVGKGLLARSMHNESLRSGKPFVSINCGAFNDALLESELFGHERGAFTGADRGRRGHFELAHTGTIFLDEIGEMPGHLQVKLLHVLEDQRVQPLGSERSIPIDVRIMAATNRDLEAEVKAGRFREDLYYRLNVISLTLPPLRERREDIQELAQSYLEHFRVRLHSDVKRVSPDGMSALMRYVWPGNLREFINAIERAVIMTTEEDLLVEDLPVRIQEFAPLLNKPVPAADAPSIEKAWLGQTWSQVRRQVLEESEYRYLVGLLRSNRGHISHTAQRAGMDPRSIREKMRRYGLKKEDFR